jgi:hypothetical protein
MEFSSIFMLLVIGLKPPFTEIMWHFDKVWIASLQCVCTTRLLYACIAEIGKLVDTWCQYPLPFPEDYSLPGGDTAYPLSCRLFPPW